MGGVHDGEDLALFVAAGRGSNTTSCILIAHQCFLHWKNIPDHQMPTPATYQGVGEIYSLEDGTCTDDMNRGVLKVILHEVCAAKA